MSQVVPGLWYQQREGRDVLLLISNMSEYSVDDVLVFDAGHRFHRSTAAIANLDMPQGTLS
jgi:hypothetical protein